MNLPWNRSAQILYAARTGEGGLRAKPCIHDQYTHLHGDVAKQIQKEMEAFSAKISKILGRDGEAHVTMHKANEEEGLLLVGERKEIYIRIRGL